MPPEAMPKMPVTSCHEPPMRLYCSSLNGCSHGVHALADVAEHAGRGDRAYGERDEADDDPASAPGGRVQHRDEHREEHQRRAQIALHDEHAHRDQPHHDDLSLPLMRQLESQHLLASHGELVAVVEQVGGEEEREEQLGELAGCSEYSPMRIQILAPLMLRPRPGIMGDSSSIRPITMFTYEYLRSTR